MSLDEIKPSLGHLGDVETLLTSSDAELSSALSAQTDAELVDACRRGEPGAWELLIRRHAGLIYTIARRYGLEADEAADVFQMVCVELWEQLNSVRDASLLKRWTAVVASRKAWQVRRARDRWSTATDDELSGRLIAAMELSPEAVAIANAEAQHLRSVIDRLSSRDRELIWYMFFDPSSPSYEAIAQRLGVSPDTVGSLRTRCLRRLRWILAEHVA